MSQPDFPLLCGDDGGRRRQLRQSGLNGLDEVEVDCAQTTLAVTFLGHAPEWITPAHLRIEGGRQVRGLRVMAVRIEASDDPGLDDRMIVSVDRPGDFSPYRLCVVALDESGHPSGGPPPGFDARYACVCFSFKAGCTSDLDCAATPACDSAPPPEPAIDYLAKDYASFRRLLLDRLTLLLPDWRERHVPDIGINLVELLAYAGDQLSYHQDAVATEAYLATARLRTSVRRHARLVNYLLHEGCNARAWVALETDAEALELNAADFYVITRHPLLDAPVLAEQDLPRTEPAPYLAFQPCLASPQDSITVRQARNRIAIYTWGEALCCLAEGATAATLADPGQLPVNPAAPDDLPPGIGEGRWHRLKLQPCDVLVFEEIVGPRTGAVADADPAHRHAVRLTRAVPSVDPLTRQLLYEVEWCAEDALPFPLCLSVASDAPACRTLTDVSIAWGNVLLVDHGLERDDPVDVVPPAGTVARCDDPCHPAETRRAPGRFRPPLPRPDPTCAGPLAACSTGSPAVCPGCGAASAAATLRQDVAAAVPQVTLYSVPCDAPANAPPRRWTARHDLLGSGPDERDFVVEIDDERVAWLRFGDGECGCAPEAGESFHARYRVGNGAAGNVAAGRLTQLVFRNRLPHGARLRARNPMAAAGGVAPEDVADARLRAPQAFRSRLARAVTADDYAAIVMRDFAASVQRAAAITRASGAVVEVQVAIDARGSAEPDPLLLGCIAGHLQAYRRLGHDLRVVPARQVPLDVALHICVKPGYLRGQVKGALLAVLGNGRAPAAAGQPGGARRGFFHPDALGLGEAIGVSRLLAAALAVEGVASAVLKRLERLFEGPDGELENGLLPIGPLEVARLDNDPGAPGNGQLTLTLEGGR